jgi:hypothetical protein
MMVWRAEDGSRDIAPPCRQGNHIGSKRREAATERKKDALAGTWQARMEEHDVEERTVGLVDGRPEPGVAGTSGLRPLTHGACYRRR